jgi:hypothetical protein
VSEKTAAVIAPTNLMGLHGRRQNAVCRQRATGESLFWICNAYRIAYNVLPFYFLFLLLTFFIFIYLFILVHIQVFFFLFPSVALGGETSFRYTEMHCLSYKYCRVLLAMGLRIMRAQTSCGVCDMPSCFGWTSILLPSHAHITLESSRFAPSLKDTIW